MMAMRVVQVDSASLQALEQIATAQLIIAIVMSLMGLIAVGAAIVAMRELRSTHRLIQALSDMVIHLRPRITPLVDSALVLTTDLAKLSEKIRLNVEDVTATLDELSTATRRGVLAAEERVRRFGAVMDVVQAEAEELMLDAAATARGVHETARRLREPPAVRLREARPYRAPRPAPPEPLDEEILEEEVLNEEP